MFDFVSLVRVLVSLRLGGSLSLILSKETVQDQVSAVQLGVQYGLLSFKAFNFSYQERESSRAVIFTCKNTHQVSLSIESFAPTIAIYSRCTCIIKAQQDFDTVCFRLLAGIFTIEAAEVFAASSTISDLNFAATTRIDCASWVMQAQAWKKELEDQTLQLNDAELHASRPVCRQIFRYYNSVRDKVDLYAEECPGASNTLTKVIGYWQEIKGEMMHASQFMPVSMKSKY